MMSLCQPIALLPSLLASSLPTVSLCLLEGCPACNICSSQETLVFEMLIYCYFQAVVSGQAEVLDPLRPGDSGRLHCHVLLC